MINKKNILKDSPDYEAYSENEVKLTAAEMRELGLLNCGGCCSSNGGCDTSKGGCNSKRGCCRQK